MLVMLQIGFSPETHLNAGLLGGNPEDLLRSMLKAFSGDLEYFAFSHGKYGALAIVDFQDEESASAAGMAIGATLKPAKALSTVLVRPSVVRGASTRANTLVANGEVMSFLQQASS